MKKRAIFLGLLCLMMISASRDRAYAACSNVSQFGAITVKIPALPSSGTYNIWTRMQAADTTHNQYSLEINGKNCYVVGGSSITAGQWTWVSFQDGDLSSKVRYDFNSKTNNSAKLIGTESGVKIDRLLLIKTDCTPIADGSNCQSSNITISAADTAGATQIPPPSNGPVSGLIIPSPTISQNKETISKVIYAVDGKQIPTATNNQLDTTLLGNGNHEVAIQTIKTNGTIVNEATTLIVENPQNAFSPISRWVRLNHHATVVASLITGGALLAIVIFLIIRRVLLNKRLLEFKGF